MSDFTPTNTQAYLAALWSKRWNDLKGTDWDVWDDPNQIEAALCYAYQKVGSEEGVLATLIAIAENYGTSLSPANVGEMADAFTVHYDSFNEPLQDHLDEEYNGLFSRYLTPEGIKFMESAIRRDSEIWIDDPEKVYGVWVFNRPGW